MIFQETPEGILEELIEDFSDAERAEYRMRLVTSLVGEIADTYVDLEDEIERLDSECIRLERKNTRLSWLGAMCWGATCILALWAIGAGWFGMAAVSVLVGAMAFLIGWYGEEG